MMGCVRYALLASVVWLSSCTTPPPPEAWEAADVMAQGYADRVARLKGKESRREQQIAAEGILLSYQADLAPSLRELCGPSCVVAVEYRFGALRLAYQDDESSVDAEREALVTALREVVYGPPNEDTPSKG